MRSTIGKTVIAVTAMAGAGAACAMTSPARPAVECRVLGATKLPAESGGAATICAAIRHAAARSAVGAFRVEVRVIGTSRLAATLITHDGQALPERRFATSDRSLTRESIARFANSLVVEVKKAQNARTS